MIGFVIQRSVSSEGSPQYQEMSRKVRHDGIALNVCVHGVHLNLGERLLKI